MKFALNRVKFIEISGWLPPAALSAEEACSYIDKMYAHAYGDRAGGPLFQSYPDRLTPNEERLIQALQSRFSQRGSGAPLLVYAGEDDYVFFREHDEYNATMSLPDEDVLR